MAAITAGKVFLDTNLLVYALDREEESKRSRSKQVLAEVGHARCGVISTQVMQELFSTCIRKLKLAPLEAKGVVQRARAFEVVQVSPVIIESAMDCVVLQQISIWDALIVAAAAAAGCRTLYTEDLQPGTTILGVRVENPLA